MAVEGSLDLFGLPEILQMISQQGKTGILTVQGQQDIVAVSFLGGRIVAADSLAHTVEEGLSKVLVSEGLISAAEFARANVENQARGGRLLDMLVERGHLTRQQLLGALRLQTVRQLEALLHWQEGEFKFYGGDEVSFEEGFDPISVEDLLLRTLADFVGPTTLPADRALPRLPPPGPAPLRPSGAGWTPAGKGAQIGPVQPRRLAGQPRPASGELWLPDVPELPEVALPGAPRANAPWPAGPPAALSTGLGGAAGAPAAHSAASEASHAPVPPVPLEGETNQTALFPAAGAGSARAVPFPADGEGSFQAVQFPAAGAGSAQPGPFPVAAPFSSSPAASSTAPGGALLPPAEPLPWPAAVMSSPSSSQAPGRPRLAPAGAMAAVAGVASAAGGEGALAAASASSQVGSFTPAGAGAGAGAAPHVPPEAAGLPGKYRQMRIDRAADRAGGLVPRLAAAALALGLVALLAAVARIAPENLLLPFPWEQAARDAFVRNQRESLFEKVAGATKTAFLRDGRFPDRLGQLRDSGLLSPADLQDPRGEPLLYTAHEDSYTLQATERGKPLADAEASESISGNFYLDSSLSQTGAKTGPPIVLLD